MLVATGLDPQRSTIFAQSHVAAHAEASWLLSSVTSYGQLGRMTQFKEKADQREFVSAGLFTYPVLMAGDILLYQTDIVPIGDDQRQHLELARDIAERFNARFGQTFVVPEGVYPEVGATDHGPPGADEADVDDERDRAGHGEAPRRARRRSAKKFKTAVTDSGREIRRGDDKPGITNLIDILSVATGKTPEAIETEYEGAGYGQFKTDVGEAVVELFRPVRERYLELRARRARAPRLLGSRGREGAGGVAPDADDDVRAHGLRPARVGSAP